MNSKVNHNKNTLVEITIHKNSSSKPKNKHFENNIGGAVSVQISPFKTPKKKKEASIVEQPKEETTIKGLLKELGEVVKVSGFENITDFVNEFESNNDKVYKETSVVKLSSQLYHTDLEEKIEALGRECLSLKNEVVRCKSDNEELSKHLKVSKEDANRLELEIFELKKLISRLTRNNADLLRMASQHFEYMDMVANLEKEGSQLSEQLSIEKCHSSDLQQKLLHAESEVALLRDLRVSAGSDILRQSSALLDQFRPGSGNQIIIPEYLFLSESCPRKPSKLSKSESSKPAYIAHICTTTLANAPSFQEEPSPPVFQPATLELAETFSTSVKITQDQTHSFTGATVNTNKVQLKSLSVSNSLIVNDISHIPTSLNPTLNSSPYRALDMSNEPLTSRCSSLTEGKFLRGLENSIELTEFSDFE